MWAFLWGLLVGAAGGFLFGTLTADPESEWQRPVREVVHRVYAEARRAAAEEEAQLKADFQRLAGEAAEDVFSG